MSMCIDSWLIWGHGLQYTAEIMTVLRSYFPIIYIYRYHIHNMPHFVDSVYSTPFENFPIKHIRSKTKYLLKTPQDVVFVLVKNEHVDEYKTGKGRFFKVRCRYSQHVKDEIRARFNPQTGRHNHIIHGTDSEGEVEYMMELLKIKHDLSFFKRNDGTPFPYHINQRKYTEGVVNISELVGLIRKRGLMKIYETPQYQYAIGNKQPYIDYFYEHFGRGLYEDHFPEKFDDMLTWDSFDPVLVKRDRILDGGKRVAILLSRGIEQTKAYMI